MRGDDHQQEGMFSYISPEKRVPADHPLRPIRKMVDEILKEMSPKFAKLYSEWDAHPLRLNVCFGLCCCRSSIRCEVNAC
jgi:hypothetical protein